MLISSSLNFHFIAKNDLYKYVDRGLSFMKDAGFDAADFPTWLLTPEIEDVREFMGKVKELGESYSIPFRVAHLPFSLRISTEPEYMPYFNVMMYRAIDAAHALGVDCAVLHPNAITEPLESYNAKKNRDCVLSHLSPFADYAAKLGVKLAIENMRVVHEHYPTYRFCQDPTDLCDIADTLGIGVCWDFGHAHISGLKQSEALRCVGKRLLTVHVNDNHTIDDDHVPPFVGTIDWRDAMKGLADIGYTGLFNYEINTSRIPSSTGRSFVEYLLSAARELIGYMENSNEG